MQKKKKRIRTRDQQSTGDIVCGSIYESDLIKWCEWGKDALSERMI